MATKPSQWIPQKLEADLIKAEKRLEGIIEDMSKQLDSETYIPRIIGELDEANKRINIHIQNKYNFLLNIAEKTKDYSKITNLELEMKKLKSLDKLISQGIKYELIKESLELYVLKLKTSYDLLDENN